MVNVSTLISNELWMQNYRLESTVKNMGKEYKARMGKLKHAITNEFGNIWNSANEDQFRITVQKKKLMQINLKIPLCWCLGRRNKTMSPSSDIV